MESGIAVQDSAAKAEDQGRGVCRTPGIEQSGATRDGGDEMGAAYRHPALKELKEQQSRYAPRERLLEQINRAEKLLAEIESEKRYPYEYLLFRITGFRAELASAQVLDGAGVRSDLRRLVEDLSAAVGQPVEQATEPVLTVEAASRRYQVSTRTITRWRGSRAGRPLDS